MPPQEEVRDRQVTTRKSSSTAIERGRYASSKQERDRKVSLSYFLECILYVCIYIYIPIMSCAANAASQWYGASE